MWKSGCSFIALVFLALGLVKAQDSLQVAHKSFEVSQPESINELLHKYKHYNEKREGIDGYRIQITYTDIREDVYRSKADMYVEFPEWNSYVDYEQPYYKLRLGDFINRLDATYCLQKVIQRYPGAFIVKDKVKLK